MGDKLQEGAGAVVDAGGGGGAESGGVVDLQDVSFGGDGIGAGVESEEEVAGDGRRRGGEGARRRGDALMEILAIDAGINRMALPSDEALERANAYGLEIRYQKSCCSVSIDSSGEAW